MISVTKEIVVETIKIDEEERKTSVQIIEKVAKMKDRQKVNREAERQTNITEKQTDRETKPSLT